ncbi:tubulin-specific chaperone C isoform X1 [Ceratina calcarata]|uniref:Tubulin-specific chaperone C isoform X1 n=1 Tax=Ceratina calcarata TaxID=156304 RepID=A0AAJ7N4A5_9HYME|nr:tubulin-specific chaperone C isoform X1 [Ceratina calcarata]XP_017876946.1 tubulin-specific chaperone C isoform X2 [Ceratina calcarata]XP_017876947.1 tubulin-specific chaperone C isoform X1 [Ceratina calcarata]XP_026667844.1 tubulin-specific chaperone C isoform X1 [Ceratina calcarata]
MDSPALIEGSLSERITKRDRERKSTIERRKEERQSLAVESEQSSYFKDTFYSSSKKIKDTLDDAPNAPTSALPGIFDKTNKDIQLLKNYLSQSKMFLKVYDIRKAQENLQLLESEASDLEMKLLPKKKFGFKNRRVVKKATDKSHDMTDGLKDLKISEGIVNGSGKQNHKLSSKYGDSACMLLGKVDEQLVLDAENVNKNDVLISDLIRCTVRIYGTPSTLHMVNLKQCTILVGPVTSSVFVHDCSECVFAFACQQLRLHSSTDCTIYLHVTSRSIIEDCTRIRIAPYNWTYDDQANHFNLAGLDPKINNWNCVDDFNWLSNEKHSPNWSVLEPESRVKSWD